jgi:PAS domain S-box-containing protein
VFTRGVHHFPVQQRTSPPPVSEFALIRTSGGVREIAAFVLGATLLLFALSFFAGPTSPSGRLATATSAVGAALALVAVSRGHVGPAASLVVASVWMAGMVIIAAAGIASPAPAMFLVALLVAAMLKGARTVGLVGLLSTLALLGVWLWMPDGFDGRARELMASRRYVIEMQLFVLIAAMTVWWARHTERASRDQDKLESQERVTATLQLAMDSARSGIAMCDERGTVLYANRAALELWGVEGSAPPIGQDAMEFWADHDAAREAIQRMMQGTNLLTEMRARRADGAEFVVEVSGARVDGPDGPAFIGSFIDISERVQAEQQLRVQRERTRAIVESTLDIVVILDREGHIVFENAAVERVLGFTPGERLGQSIMDHAHPDDVAAGGTSLGQLLTHPAALARVTMRFRHKDGSWRWLETVGRNMCDEPAIGGILGVGRDITEQLEIKSRLEATERLETVGRLAGGVAHDFNNLLTAIMGNADLARELEQTEDTQRHLDGILQAAEQARQLTQKLLGFARREHTQPVVVDLRTRLRDVHQLLLRLLTENIQLETDAGTDALPVLIDPVQFEQILLNLAANARDAMPDGGTLRITAERVHLGRVDPALMGAMRPGPAVRVLAVDTGHGMPASVVARVFEPFFSTKAPGRGTGLGLSTVYGSVVQAGGAIRVLQTGAAGTTFEIVFPLSDAPAPALERTLESSFVPPDGLVLIAEDDGAVRALMHEVLTQAGCRVIMATDGAAAITLAEEHGDAIALLVTDVVMPRVGGQELAVQFRRMNPDGRILFVTGYSSDPSLAQLAKTLHAGILLKPFHVDALLAKCSG